METLQTKWSSIGHLLEQAASEHKDKPLFIYQGERLSFDETNRRVNRLANALQGLGMTKGDQISVMLPNGFDFPITWLAIGKLGAVMVPTNINYQAHDLVYLLNDSEARAMVIHQDYVPLLDQVRDQVPGLEIVVVVGSSPTSYYSCESLTSAASDAFTIEGVDENDLLNIQYTSGTTGFPKGCMLSHRYWLLFGMLVADLLDVYPHDVNLTAQPFYYLDPQWNVVLCLAYGIPLVIMHRFSPSQFWPAVQENGVTFFYVLGTMPFYLLKQKENPEIEKNHKLRFVMCSGIHPEFHATFEERWNVPWREAFGMTETGADLAVRLEETDCVGSGAMGTPVRTKEVRVVDEQGDETPDGEIGEMVLRGEPMMLGYWKKPEATAEATRGGWFHTGDLVYKDEKGRFHWTGRIKDMVRRSGENISTAEVEGVLVQHDKVQVAAVLAAPDLLRGEEVKVYLVLREGETKETVPPQ